jgi:hypothetical protein
MSRNTINKGILVEKNNIYSIGILKRKIIWDIEILAKGTLKMRRMEYIIKEIRLKKSNLLKLESSPLPRKNMTEQLITYILYKLKD